MSPLNPASSVSGGVSSRDAIVWSGLGLISETFDIRLATNAVAPGTQLLEASAIGLVAGDSITNIVTCLTVGASGTAPTLIKCGLFDQNFNLVASTADLHASAIWTNTGYAIAPLSSVFTVSTTGLYFCGWLKNGVFSVTNPTFLHGTTQTLAGHPITGSARHWWEQSTLTDLPNPAVPANPGNAAMWFGVS